MSTITYLETSTIRSDPERFQFKRDTTFGVTDELRTVRVFDPRLAGVIAVWVDPADGGTYVVNGHHRLELAVRVAHTPLACLQLAAADDREARTVGALINIAEGRGSALDAAVVFREGCFDETTLRSRGVSPEGPVARDGIGLARLSPTLFREVVLHRMSVARGAMIGHGLPDHEHQHGLFKLLTHSKRSLSDEEVRELIRLSAASGASGREDRQGGFGFAQAAESLAVERAQLSAAILQRLRERHRLFRTVSTAKSQAVLSEQSNVIQVSRNRSASTASAMLVSLFQRLSLSCGPVSDALTAGAREVRAGARVDVVAAATIAVIRSVLEAMLPGVQLEA